MSIASQKLLLEWIPTKEETSRQKLRVYMKIYNARPEYKAKRKEYKRKWLQKIHLSSPMIPCKCGCGELIHSINSQNKPARFKHGHNNILLDETLKKERPRLYRETWKDKKHLNSPLIPCACGRCDELIHTIGKQGTLVHFKHGHSSRGKLSQETIDKIKASKHAGHSITYGALHAWVRRNLSEPKLCELCKKVPPHDLANKTGVYNREFHNWFYLCCKCHRKYDGTMFGHINIIKLSQQRERTKL